MAGELILIVTAATADGDRFAQALSQQGNHYAFVFAHDAASAVAVASSLEPDLILLVLNREEGIRACQELRNVPETRRLRVLLVLDHAHLSLARTCGASAIVMQPASALMLASEARKVIERVERRCVWIPDRRTGSFRGGRRASDIAAG